MYLFKKRLKRLILISLTCSTIATIPFLVINLMISRNIGHYYALQRMGVISYRYPGSLSNLIICGFVILAISLKYFSLGKKKTISSKEQTLVITCAGLIIASQSNIITNQEIQFYHFLFLSSVNFMIFLGIVIYGLNLKNLKVKLLMKKRKLQSRYVLISVLLISLINSSNLILKPIITEWGAGVPILTDGSKIIKNKNVIVDNLDIQNTLSIYEDTNILYNRVIAANSYTNKEVFERAYVSGGCPDKVTELFISSTFVYRISGLEQKGIALKGIAEKLNLERHFASLYEPIIASSKKQNAEIFREISKYKMQIDKDNCLIAAKNFKIDTIFFDELSNWKSIVESLNLSKEKIRFGNKTLYAFKI